MSAAWITLLLAAPLTLAVSAFCSAMETALFSLSYQDFQRLRRESGGGGGGGGAGEAVARLLRRPRAVLVTLLLINTVANITYLVVTSLFLMSDVSPWVAAGVNVFNVIALTLVGEVLSKTLAGRLRVELARRLGPTVWVLVGVVGPVRTTLERGVLGPLVRLLTPSGLSQGGARLSEEELRGLLSLGQREGSIGAGETGLLRQLVRMNSLQARDVMIPRTEVEWIDAAAGRAEVEAIVARTGATRLPVVGVGASIDGGALGMLNTKRYLAGSARGQLAGVSATLEPAHYVPERASLEKLLDNLRTRGIKTALCVDEHGGVTGLVRVQDAAARLVAESAAGAQAEGNDAEPAVRMVGLGAWEVSGRLSAVEWSEMFGLPQDRRATTVAGLIMTSLDRVPRVGDRVSVGNVWLEVLSLDGRVADRVLVRLNQADGQRQGQAEGTPEPAARSEPGRSDQGLGQPGRAREGAA
ncbi:MAG: hypothetical protein C0513_03705 [Isosphaera sp.]|nr:hypothetical protein [Isosphaera sp.]